MGETHHRSQIARISRVSRALVRFFARTQQWRRCYILAIVGFLLTVVFRPAYNPELSISSNILENQLRGMKAPWNLIVVAPTFYKDSSEIRYQLGLEACRQAAKHHFRLILVDASPHDEIRTGLEKAGKPVVKVEKQQSVGKGAALREAIQIAHDEASKSKTPTVIGFMELEKVDLFRHWHYIVYQMFTQNSDVAVPWRSDSSFHDTYPIEQYHAETFANLYLNSLGKEIGLTPIDWTIGPVAFKSSFSIHWLEYGGDSYDVQLVPLINAYSAGAQVSSVEVDYRHAVEMKEMESGSPTWSEKRLMQLNFLKDLVGTKLKETGAKK
jgi:hypothetical protein